MTVGRPSGSISNFSSEEEGKRNLQLQQERFTPYVLQYKDMIKKMSFPKNSCKSATAKRKLSSSKSDNAPSPSQDEEYAERQCKYRMVDGLRVVDVKDVTSGSSTNDLGSLASTSEEVNDNLSAEVSTSTDVYTERLTTCLLK